MPELNIEDKESSFDFIKQVVNYISWWKFILLSIIICLVIAFFYLRLSTPIYSIYSTILLKDDQKGGNQDELSVLQQWGIASGGHNVDNEIQILSSWSLSKQVVKSLELYKSYYYDGFFKKILLYKNSPYSVHVKDTVLKQLESPFKLKLRTNLKKELSVEFQYKKQKYNYIISQFPFHIDSPYGELTLLENKEIKPKIGENLIVVISPLEWTTNNFRRHLNINATSKTTSMVYLSTTDQNIRRGKDFINKLVELYNSEALREKNQSALNIESFIAERLKKIGNELEDVKRNMEEYKRLHGLYELKSSMAISLKERSNYSHQKEELITQIKMVTFLEQYMNDSTQFFRTLPSNMGINDRTLINLAERYNAIVTKYKQVKQRSTLDNPTALKLLDTLLLLKKQVLASIASVKQALNIAIKNVDIQLRFFTSSVLKAPTQERRISEIKRWEKVKTSLFMILSRKREENALKLAVNTEKARIIDPALSSGVAVYPRPKWVYLIALLLGLGIPFLVLYLKDLIDFKISSSDDIRALSDVTIIGELPVKEKQKEDVVVHVGQNDKMVEAFRNIRTNLKFYSVSGGQQNILITSSMPGEGKTFVSINLAISLSLLDKKVLLVGLDVRKPVLARVLNLDAKNGVTNYLSGAESDYEKLIQPSGITSNLEVITSGRIPLNPGELIQNERLDKMIYHLRQKYDYLILDTPPIGLVSDAVVLGRLSDISLYIVRAGVTHKKHLAWMNDVKKNCKIPNLSIVFNGVETKSGTYGYGDYSHKD